MSALESKPSFPLKRKRLKCVNAVGLGLKKGDRVAVLAYNAVEWVEIYIAAAKAGLVAVPLNFRLVGSRSATS